jgi:hypothetical protein
MKENEISHDELKQLILADLQIGSFTEPQLATLHAVATRRIRFAIRSLVEEGQPVVNLGCGFFLSDNPEIIEAAAKRLEKHGVGILVRAANLRKINPVKYLKQLAIDFKRN